MYQLLNIIFRLTLSAHAELTQMNCKFAMICNMDWFLIFFFFFFFPHANILAKNLVSKYHRAKMLLNIKQLIDNDHYK